MALSNWMRINKNRSNSHETVFFRTACWFRFVDYFVSKFNLCHETHMCVSLKKKSFIFLCASIWFDTCRVQIIKAFSMEIFVKEHFTFDRSYSVAATHVLKHLKCFCIIVMLLTVKKHSCWSNLLKSPTRCALQPKPMNRMYHLTVMIQMCKKKPFKSIRETF